ncbi:MAG: hypothetical protein AAF467_22360 [Actinomycetota bacterium]
MSTQRAGHSRRRSRRLTGAIALTVTMVVSVLGISSPAAAEYKLSLGDHVSFSDGAPAAGVKVDVFDAVDRWTRGQYLGTATTDANGTYGFEVGSGCYITVAIAPLGTEFGAVGSGRVYDQQHGCVEDGPNNDFDSVLYRGDSKPEPTPTTQPPVTHPPTTAPPTTAPPADPPRLVSCSLLTDRGGQVGGLGWIVGGLKIEGEIPDGAVIALLDTYGNVLERQEFIDSDWDLYVYRLGVERSANWRNGFYTIGENNWRISGIRGWRQMRLEYPGQKKDSEDIRCAYEFFSPIGLDLDGSGAVERIAGEFSFDFDANGEAEVVSEWFAPSEGILFDARIAGPVTGEHLFGDQGGRYADGFEKLALLDADSDGWVTGAELNGLAIWTDANGNAVLDPGEQSTLADHGVRALSVSHQNLVSEALLADGSVMMTEDLWFPAATGTGGVNTVRVAVLGGAGVALLALAVAAARRRRDSLDGELDELLTTEAHTNP